MFNAFTPGQQPVQQSRFTQTQGQNPKQNIQSGNKFQKQYTDKLYNIAGFSFPYNNLLLVCIMRRIGQNEDPNHDQRESYFGFVTFVKGVGTNANRTYDFNQKIVQKFSLKDLSGLAFVLKQLAVGNADILPYSKFTNSGTGSKSLYIQMNDNSNQQNNPQQNQQNQQYSNNNRYPQAPTFTLGSAHDKFRINLVLTKADAYSIGEMIENLFKTGLDLEIKEQMRRSTDKSRLMDSGGNGYYNPNQPINGSTQYPVTQPAPSTSVTPLGSGIGFGQNPNIGSNMPQSGQGQVNSNGQQPTLQQPQQQPPQIGSAGSTSSTPFANHFLNTANDVLSQIKS